MVVSSERDTPVTQVNEGGFLTSPKGAIPSKRMSDLPAIHFSDTTPPPSPTPAEGARPGGWARGGMGWGGGGQAKGACLPLPEKPVVCAPTPTPSTLNPKSETLHPAT